MKTSRVFGLFLLGIALMTSQMAMAQCREFKWPEDKAKAEEKVALYGDALRIKNYQAAVNPHRWMMQNAPDWNVRLYIDGAEIFDNLAEKEKDPARKAVLVDSMLMMYDLRIKYCGDEANVLNRKVYYDYKYNVKNKARTADVLKLFEKVATMNGTNMSDGNLVAYMTTVQANKILLNNITDEQILQHYDRIISILDDKLKTEKNEKDIKKLKDYKSVVDDLLIGMVKVDCDFVKNNLAPKFKQNPNDIALAKRIFSFMLQGKCTDDPLWVEAGEAIHNVEKDFGLAKTLGLKYLSNDNNAKAETLLKEALELASTPEDKSAILLYLGTLEVKRGSKSTAREYFRQSVAADPNNKEGYEKIGDLYYGSYNDCAKQESMAQDRLVYIAAYDMYRRAGHTTKMAQAKSQFPSKEEIFLLNWKVGENKSVGCWVGETVSLDTRD
ncbi:MAG: tetratricopeptide repeat protein [Cyclobacteriaceae bacterium]